VGAVVALISPTQTSVAVGIVFMIVLQSQLVLEEWQDQEFYISNDDIHCFVSSQPPVPLMLQPYWPLFKAALGL
jgi:hypothetical protein